MDEDKELIYMYIVEYFIKVYTRVEQSTKFLCEKNLYLFTRFEKKKKTGKKGKSILSRRISSRLYFDKYSLYTDVDFNRFVILVTTLADCCCLNVTIVNCEYKIRNIK